jgi:hypothetical protein
VAMGTYSREVSGQLVQSSKRRSLSALFEATGVVLSSARQTALSSHVHRCRARCHAGSHQQTVREHQCPQVADPPPRRWVVGTHPITQGTPCLGGSRRQIVCLLDRRPQHQAEEACEPLGARAAGELPAGTLVFALHTSLMSCEAAARASKV